MKFGLHGIRRLLYVLDNPERRFLSIHIAGTNGKGSVAALLAAILTAAGYKTGLYTSPHLIDYRERIRINGVAIPRKRIVSLVNRLRPEIAAGRNTFFEATTAIAFQYFAEERVDIAVIETGLGGRLDATNVLKPLLSVITTIGLDHTEILGKTIGAIAAEKAGIIKKRIPCVTGVERGVALQVIRQRCAKQFSLLRTTREVRIHPKRMSLSGSTVDIQLADRMLEDINISLAGSFQFKNVATAILALDELNRRGTLPVTSRAIRKGLGNVGKLTGLRGRLSLVRTSPVIICDVAHNPDAARSLSKTLSELGVGKVNLLFGVMRDKDYGSMVDILGHSAARMAFVRAKTSRSAPPEDLKRAASEVGLVGRTFDTVREGLSFLLERRSRWPILITGSHFVVGEALAFLEGKKYLTINQ
jgi:dihydrofolate synthase/folylpolyglutamate synthase